MTKSKIPTGARTTHQCRHRAFLNPTRDVIYDIDLPASNVNRQTQVLEANVHTGARRFVLIEARIETRRLVLLGILEVRRDIDQVLWIMADEGVTADHAPTGQSKGTPGRWEETALPSHCVRRTC